MDRFRGTDPVEIQVEVDIDCGTPDETIANIRAAAVGLVDCDIETTVHWGETAWLVLTGWREATDIEIGRLRAREAQQEAYQRAQYEKLRAQYGGS